MINIYNSNDHTNSCSTSGWNINEKPFKAFRAYGSNHIGFMPFCNGFDCDKPNKIIVTKKGTKLLVNCPPEQEQFVYLVHLTGGFRGNFVKEYIFNVEIVNLVSSSKHCNPSCSCVFKTAKNSKWFAIFQLSGRYHPYYYCFSDENKKTPLIIESTKEFESYCDINNYNIEI